MNDTHDTTREPHASGVLRMSAQDFAAWGVDVAAYVKTVPVVNDAGKPSGTFAFSIHAADGRHLGIADTRELAFAAILREGMEAVSVH